MKKEDILKILNRHILIALDKYKVADEILALDNKEEFPKYGKFITNSGFGSYTKNKIYKIIDFDGTHYLTELNDEGSNTDGHTPQHWQFVDKSEFDKQQLQEQIANLKHELTEQRILTKDVAQASSKSQISQNFSKP